MSKKLRPINEQEKKTSTKHKSNNQNFDIGRFFMPNVEKMAKSLAHELSDTREELNVKAACALKNQEVIIAQNQKIIELLGCINSKMNSAQNDEE